MYTATHCNTLQRTATLCDTQLTPSINNIRISIRCTWYVHEYNLSLFLSLSFSVSLSLSGDANFGVKSSAPSMYTNTTSLSISLSLSIFPPRSLSLSLFLYLSGDGNTPDIRRIFTPNLFFAKMTIELTYVY